jgi:thioredoxin-related protein
MKRTILFSVFLSLFSFSAIFSQGTAVKEEGLEWHTDLMKAQDISKASGKPIFAFFTGSDWCGWCIKLQRNVLEKPGFKEWAKKNVVLLELDFPRRKQQAPELQQQNAGLQQAFGVQGYPTVWIFFMNKDEATNKFNITPLGNLGYPNAQPGSEESEFLKKANSILTNKAAIK